MAVLEAERVAELVDHGVVVVVAGDRVLARVAEPDVAAGDGGVRIVGVGGRGVGVVAEADGAGAGAGAGEEDVEVGEALDREAEVAGAGVVPVRGVQHVVGRRHLRGVEAGEAGERLGRVADVVVGGAVGEGIVDVERAPLHPGEEAVDELVVGAGHEGHADAGGAGLGGAGFVETPGRGPRLAEQARRRCDGHDGTRWLEVGTDGGVRGWPQARSAAAGIARRRVAQGGRRGRHSLPPANDWVQHTDPISLLETTVGW